MIALGVDLGERRIGLAASDPLGLTARAVMTIPHVSLAQDVARVGEVARRQRAQRIVVGLPLNMDGSVGPAARRATRFANALRRNLSVEVVLWDERLSTREAQEALALKRGPGRERGDDTDEVAAAVMLQDYLNTQGREQGQ